MMLRSHTSAQKCTSAQNCTGMSLWPVDLYLDLNLHSNKYSLCKVPLYQKGGIYKEEDEEGGISVAAQELQKIFRPPINRTGYRDFEKGCVQT